MEPITTVPEEKVVFWQLLSVTTLTRQRRSHTGRSFMHEFTNCRTKMQEIIDLLWYQGISQQEAAICLGVSERTVQRRWRQTCLHLHEALQGLPP